MNKLLKRGKRQRSGILSKRGPGTSKNFNQVRMHFSEQKKSRIEPVVLKLTKRISKGVFVFAKLEFTSVRTANNWCLAQRGGE